MSERREQVLILVKAVPRPSKKHGETVCCAGVTPDRQWRRLYPVRFRQLGETRFKRWQWVTYQWQPPRNDYRRESRHIFEDRLIVGDLLSPTKRSALLEPMLVGSVKEASATGASLALIRPRDVKFTWRKKRPELISAEREGFRIAASQTSLLDESLQALEPCPYEFRFTFVDQDGRHHHSCGDWETTAAFWKFRKERGEQAALDHLNRTYNQAYPERGMALALGTMAKRPRTWLLLGVIRLDQPVELPLFS